MTEEILAELQRMRAELAALTAEIRESRVPLTKPSSDVKPTATDHVELRRWLRKRGRSG